MGISNFRFTLSLSACRSLFSNLDTGNTYLMNSSVIPYLSKGSNRILISARDSESRTGPIWIIISASGLFQKEMFTKACYFTLSSSVSDQ
jgi:hypothetical protein